MNILLDTNIIIPLEDTSRILDTSFAELRKLSAEQQHCLYIHPIQFEDINRDKNQERQKIVLSRLRQYSQIENPPILSGRILKLCTFKVDTMARGKKLGERLLYIAFDYCVKNKLDWVYLHTFGEEQKTLVGLCLDYGFYCLGKYKQDDVYIKPMKLMDDNCGSLDSLIRYYPYFRDNESVQKFIIPIQPQYHEDLFPDFSSMKGSLFEKEQSLYSCQGNTIKKAYLCHSRIKSIRKGDIVLFYRSKDRKSIQCMGIVEDVLASENIDEVFPAIAKRTVYNYSDLQQILKKKTLVILFRYIALGKEISYQQIAKAKIEGYIQSIRKIDNQQYSALIHEN